MLANLMPPLVERRTAAVMIVESTEASAAFVVVHPRYRAWLAKCGLVRPEAYLELQGEIVSGHANRHVMKVELPSGKVPRIVYLKREHHVGWKVRLRNWRDGFGFVARSVREAKLLAHLDERSLPGPQWIAYGEDARGRAFLMVDDLAGSVELRTLANKTANREVRRDLCRLVGESIAEFHGADISTPDLAAKHIFIRPETGGVSILDWPSARCDNALTFAQRAKALAQLDASLAGELISPRERLRCLRAYCRRLWGQPGLREWLRQIQTYRPALRRSSSIRDQLCDPALAGQQRLVWLADAEAVCVTPTMAKHWPEPAITAPYYGLSSETIQSGESQTIDAPDGEPATLLRWRSFAPLGHVIARLRSKPWRSPAMTLARQLFRKQRLGIPAPLLLAFGQQHSGWLTVDSFVLLRKGDERPC